MLVETFYEQLFEYEGGRAMLIGKLRLLKGMLAFTLHQTRQLEDCTLPFGMQI